MSSIAVWASVGDEEEDCRAAKRAERRGRVREEGIGRREGVGKDGAGVGMFGGTGGIGGVTMTSRGRLVFGGLMGV